MINRRVDTEEDESEVYDDSSDDDERFYISGQRLLRPVRIGEPLMTSTTESNGGNDFRAILNDREYGNSIVMDTSGIGTATSDSFEKFLIPESARKVVRQRLSNRLSGSFEVTAV